MSVWDQAVPKRSKDRAGASGRWPGGQAEMSENPRDHKGIYNGSDDLQGANAMGQFSIHTSYSVCMPAKVGMIICQQRYPFL